MFTTKQESDFFLGHIKRNHKVLEYGSGDSTLEISSICEKMISIEHQKNWFETVRNQLPPNATILLREPDLAFIEGTYNCGTFDEFRSYITAPVEFERFDIILIDGRARVECAKFCEKIADSETLIFIHDFTSRLENHNYKDALLYLDLIESVGDMSKFRLKI